MKQDDVKLVDVLSAQVERKMDSIFGDLHTQFKDFICLTQDDLRLAAKDEKNILISLGESLKEIEAKRKSTKNQLPRQGSSLTLAFWSKLSSPDLFLIKKAGIAVDSLRPGTKEFLSQRIINNALLSKSEKEFLARIIGAICLPVGRSEVVLLQLATGNIGISGEFFKVFQNNLKKILEIVTSDKEKIKIAHMFFLETIENKLKEKLMADYKPQVSKWLYQEIKKSFSDDDQPGSSLSIKAKQEAENTYNRCCINLAKYLGISGDTCDWQKINEHTKESATQRHIEEETECDIRRADDAGTFKYTEASVIASQCRKEYRDLLAQCETAYRTLATLTSTPQAVQKKLSAKISSKTAVSEFSEFKHLVQLEILENFIQRHEIVIDFNETPLIAYDLHTHVNEIFSEIKGEKYGLFDKHAQFIPKFYDYVKPSNHGFDRDSIQLYSYSIWEDTLKNKLKSIRHQIARQFENYYTKKTFQDDHCKKARDFVARCSREMLCEKSTAWFLKILCEEQYRPIKSDSQYVEEYYYAIRVLQSCLSKNEEFSDPDFVELSSDSKLAISPPAYFPAVPQKITPEVRHVEMDEYVRVPPSPGLLSQGPSILAKSSTPPLPPTSTSPKEKSLSLTD